MVAIPYGSGTYNRIVAGLPEVRLVNQYAEQSPVAGIVLVARPGLVANMTLGAGPTRGIFSKPGCFGGDVFTVSGGTLYRGPVAVGAVPGVEAVSMDGNELELMIGNVDGLYRYNGTSVAAVATPDGSGVRSVAYMASRFLYVRSNTGKIYWSDILSGAAIDPLSFATAEAMPDPLVAVLLIGDVLWLFGQASVEFWANTGDPDAPFAPIQGRVYARGCIYTDTARLADNTGVWVGEDRVVYRGGATPERISTHGIEDKIAEGPLKAWVMPLDGHLFYILIGSTFAGAYDFSTQQWCELSSYGRASFRAHCGVAVGTDIYAGDDTTGTIWAMDGSVASDDGAAMQRVFTAGLTHAGKTFPCTDLQVDASVGQTADLSGQGANPVIEMRFSRDGGNTWSDWAPASLGAMGKYRNRAAWRRLGLIDAPGRVFEFRVTDPVPWQLSGVRMNEINGSLSR